MPSAGNVLKLDVNIVETGLWRDCCMLPSGCRVVVTLVSNPTRVFARGVWCRDCGERSAE